MPRAAIGNPGRSRTAAQPPDPNLFIPTRFLVERSPYARAWDYLSYAPAAKWCAMLTAAGAGVCYVLLVLILGLFADLMVSRGRISGYSDLQHSERLQFQNDWNAMADDDRRAALHGLSERASAAELENLAGPAGGDALPSPADSLRWRAYVGWVLQRRAGADAAAEYRRQAGAVDTAVASAPSDQVQLGALSLVLRTRHHPISRILGWLARWNPWMWRSAGLPNRPYLAGLLVLAVVIAALRLALATGMHHFAARATLEAVTRLRRMLYHHANRLGSLTVVETGPSEALNIFTQSIEDVHAGVYAQLTTLIAEPVKFILLIAVALSIHLWLGFAFLCAALLIWIVGRQIATYFRRQGRLGARRAANQLALLQESVTMMRLIKGYLMELFNQARVERQLAEYAKAQTVRFRGEAIYRPLLICFGTLAAAVLLFVGGWIVLGGGLNAAGLFLMAVALASSYSPLDTWLAQHRLVKRSEDAAAELFAFLDRRGDVGQVAGAEFLKAMSDKLEFDRVSLREPRTGRMLLDNLTMTIPAGQRVAIVGAEAPEKYALVSLILRFLDPSSGEVRIDGRNLRWVTLDSLRSQIALILQQNLIFNDTVANNIGCGDPSFSIPQIIEAAKMAHAHNFIQRLPYGYETQIGDLGHSLGLGEQFRIAVARAILRDPAIIIVEEPKNSLNEDSIAMLDDAYDRVLPGRTVIFLPHRLSTLKMCDRVYLIHNGALEAEGEHRELLRESELYRHLHYLEYNMFAEQV
jgi:ABC-type multidrug transport system fused ATPase/permease subunit